MSIFFLLFGLIFALAGAAIIWDYYIVVTSYEILKGTVKGFRTRYKRSGRNKSFMYYPVIEYVAYGTKKEFQSNSGASWPMYDIGESVEVYYSRKYDDGRLKSLTQAVIGPVFIVIGLGICYIFWTRFQMSLFTQITAAGISGVVAWYFGKFLRKKEIKSIPEFTNQMRSLPKKVRHKKDPDEGNLITKQSELLSSDLPGNKNLNIIGPLFTVIGLIAIVAAVYVGMNRWDFLERAESTDGTVIEFKTSTDDDGTTYYPVVAFKPLHSNHTLTFKHDVGSSPPSYRQGEVVPVFYDPEDAQHAIINEGLWNWFGPLIISVMGLLFSFAGITVTRKWMKIKRYKKNNHPQ